MAISKLTNVCVKNVEPFELALLRALGLEVVRAGYQYVMRDRQNKYELTREGVFDKAGRCRISFVNVHRSPERCTVMCSRLDIHTYFTVTSRSFEITNEVRVVVSAGGVQVWQRKLTSQKPFLSDDTLLTDIRYVYFTSRKLPLYEVANPLAFWDNPPDISVLS
jgi:hypothetical protein